MEIAQPQEIRCFGGPDDPLMMAYHDDEWGMPLHDDRAFFEFLCLEGAQAGLSWRTILHKRERYREVFDDFDAEKVAAYTEADRQRLLADAGIVRNKLKVNAFNSGSTMMALPLRLCSAIHSAGDTLAGATRTPVRLDSVSGLTFSRAAVHGVSGLVP